MVTHKKFPSIGGRIIKSAIAVALCMVIYYLRTLLPIGNGIPFYSALAALWCMQPYADSMKNNAGQRSIGTFTGAVYGLLFIVFLHTAAITSPVIVYLLASVMIIPVIYTTVVMNKRNASFFSCVVFLSIALTHSFDEDPYLFVLNRVLDTFIGIGVGLAVNEFHIPIKHRNDTLFVSGIDDVLISDSPSAVQYSKVELNRLIAAGARFTVSTVRTPAEVRTIMSGVDLKLPLIVMDGAALYDMKGKRYLEAEFLPRDVSTQAEKIISECDMHCFVNVMYDATLLIYYGEFRNIAEKELYDSHCHSTYRNYIRSSLRRYDAKENVLYITVLAEKTKVFEIKRRLDKALGEKVRLTVSLSEYKGFLYLKVFSPLASKHEMMKKLKAYTGAEKIVTIGSIKGEYDVYISDGGGNASVKKLKKLYREGS